MNSIPFIVFSWLCTFRVAGHRKAHLIIYPKVVVRMDCRPVRQPSNWPDLRAAKTISLDLKHPDPMATY